MHLFNPVTLTFDYSRTLFLGYSKVIPYTKFEHFESFVFELCCGQTDIQRKTNSIIQRRVD